VQIISVAEAFLDLPCDIAPVEREYPNVKYVDHPCATIPRIELLGLTQR
jgi:hypothetical protein